MRIFKISALLAVVLLIVGGAVSVWQFGFPFSLSSEAPEAGQDVYVRFAMEGYDIIRENYWQEATDADAGELFRLSAGKAADKTLMLASTTRNGVEAMLQEAFATSTDAGRKQIAVNTLIVVLANLAPQGRNGLLSAKQEASFRNDVANIDPQSDLYKELGLQKGASVAAIGSAYTEKKKELMGTMSPSKEEDLARLAYVNEVLSKETSKEIYDQTKAEPTVFTKMIGTHTLSVAIKQVAPTTLQEFAVAVGEAVKKGPVSNLVIDLRSNIGGSLDFATYFLGMFVGPHQYAFDLFHQGNYEPGRTPDTIPRIEELEKFSSIAILTDSMTQSTAELTTAAMKRLKLALVVGQTTRGWGTVENTYPIHTSIDHQETYSILLVNRITLRDDQQPIEGRGVEPDVNTNDAGWQKKLTKLFPSNMAAAIETLLATPPAH